MKFWQLMWHIPLALNAWSVIKWWPSRTMLENIIGLGLFLIMAYIIWFKWGGD